MNPVRAWGAVLMAIWLLLTAAVSWAAVVAWPISIPLAILALPVLVVLAFIWALWFIVALVLLIV